MKGFRIAHRTGSIVLLLLAAMHLAAQLAGDPPNANETETRLFELARSYKFHMTGLDRSLMDFQDGFSLSYTVMAAGLAVLNLILVSPAAATPRWVLRRVTLVDAAVLALLLGLAIRYFIVPPMVMLAVVFLAWVTALALLPRGPEPAAGASAGIAARG